jgi:DNA-binding NarL/FixJ family response regulator
LRDQAKLPQHVPSVTLIVEDHDILRANLYDWLSAIFVGHSFLTAKSGEQALVLAVAQRPDIVLMDITLPAMDGIEATQRLKLLVPQTQIVILWMHEDRRYRLEALAAGASDFVCKRTMSEDLLPAIRQLLG